MPLPDGPFIFVSYANKDYDFVHLEIGRLKSEGYKLWYDQEGVQPSRFWADEIREAITACACFMVFITEDSVVSNHVREEITQALSENKPFIGVYWDNVELPAGLQELVRKRQTLDRHSMQSAYEGPLSTALSEYVRPEPKDDVLLPLPPPGPDPDILAKVVFFGLIVAALINFSLVLVVNIAPPFISKTPAELENNRFVGLISGINFAVIGLGLSGAAFAVFRKYLRKEND